jgi:hypothetical protein
MGIASGQPTTTSDPGYSRVVASYGRSMAHLSSYQHSLPLDGSQRWSSKRSLAMLVQIYGRFAAHIRCLRRQVDADHLSQYDQVVDTHLQSPSFDQFFFKRRYLLASRATMFDISQIGPHTLMH